MDMKSRVEYIIKIYDRAETSDVYNRRSNNESKNIKSVLKAIQDRRFTLTSVQNRADFIHILKAADSISLNVGTNYLEQFLQIPDVQKIVEERFKEGSFAKVIDKARNNKQAGKLPNFKTTAEEDKEAANIYLTSVDMLKGRTPEQEIERFNNHISDILDTGVFSIKTEATQLQDATQRQELMTRLGRVLLRQKGMNPSKVKLENGKIQFKMDVPDKEPIFHGMRKEQGLSIAQQEEIKKKQEAEERHQQEQLSIAKEKKEQQELNNTYSEENRKKRDEEQKNDEKRSNQQTAKEALMEQARKKQQQKTSVSAFRDSLRASIDANRKNTMQAQNQTRTKKHSNSRGMSR